MHSIIIPPEARGDNFRSSSSSASSYLLSAASSAATDAALASSLLMVGDNELRRRLNIWTETPGFLWK